MKKVLLSDICETGSGGTPSRSRHDVYYEGGTIPWVKSGELATGQVVGTEEMITERAIRESSAKLLQPGGLLLAMYGATVGQVARLRISAATNQAVCHIRPDPSRCETDYLYWFLVSSKSELLQQRVGGGQPNISQAIIRDLEVPLPDRDQQVRIATILDKADAIRRKRQQALLLTDDFLRSVFLDMFGDLMTNPRGWPIKTLSEGVAEFEGGRNVMPTDTPRADGVRVLKVSAVTSGEYKPHESKSFDENEEFPDHYIVREGDLLISRANTSELVGAVAYVWETQGREMLPDKLWRFVWPQERTIEPLFMLHLARSRYFREQLIQRATGSSGSMKNIGKAKMLEIPIPVPPIDLQRTFSRIATRTRLASEASTISMKQAGDLFSCLQQRAFSGQL